MRVGPMGLAPAAALLAWVTAASGGPEARPAADDIHRTIERILAGDEFATTRGSDVVMRLVERVLEALGRALEALGRLFGPPSIAPGASGVIAAITHYLMLTVVAAIVVYLLFLLGRWIVCRLSSAEEGGAPFATEAAVEPIAETPGRASILRQKAAEAYAGGDLRQAIRLYFLAYLASLSAAGLIRFSPRSTNGDYARHLAEAPSRRDEFRAAAGCFELAWYGGASPAAGDVAAMDALTSGAEGGAP